MDGRTDGRWVGRTDGRSDDFFFETKSGPFDWINLKFHPSQVRAAYNLLPSQRKYYSASTSPLPKSNLPEQSNFKVGFAPALMCLGSPRLSHPPSHALPFDLLVLILQGTHPIEFSMKFSSDCFVCLCCHRCARKTSRIVARAKRCSGALGQAGTCREIERALRVLPHSLDVSFDRLSFDGSFFFSFNSFSMFDGEGNMTKSLAEEKIVDGARVQLRVFPNLAIHLIWN